MPARGRFRRRCLHTLYNRDDEFLSLVSGEIEAILAVA